MAAILPVTEAQLGAIMAIESAVHLHPWPLAQFAQRLDKPSQFSWYYRCDGELLGYCFVSQVLDQAELLNIAVAKKAQGRGIARALIEHFIQHLPRPLSEVFLELRESNQRALELYQGLGFNEIARRSGYYPAAGGKGREDALVMAYHLLD